MVIITKILTEETKKKRLDGYYKKAVEKAKSEIGNKYGRLTITDIDYEKTYNSYYNCERHHVYVKTICECGKIPQSNTLSSIKSGHIKSCGCSKFNNSIRVEDLTGKKFGRLTVKRRDVERDVQELKEGKQTNTHWLCVCDCGNPELISVTGCALKSGHTQSCGCFASEQIAVRNKKYSTKSNKYIDNNDGTYFLFDDNGNKCLIDKEDYEIVKRWFWRKTEKRGDINKGYWETNVKKDDKYNKKVLKLHQVIAEIKYGKYNSEFPDHLSRDTDDNRKCNIILKSNQKNCHNRSLSKNNSSGKTGVSFNKEKALWVAYITVDYKTILLGTFSQFNDAVSARKEAEFKYGFTCDDVVASYDN